MKKSIFILPVVLMFLAGCTESNVRQASNEFSDLPAAVQKAVRDKVPNAEIADVEHRRRDGHTTYMIQFRDARLHPAMEVAADGTLLKYEAGADAFGRPDDREAAVKGTGSRFNLSALPVEVQKAIEKNAPRAEVVDVRRRDDAGKLTYEIEYAGREPRPTLHVTVDGTVVKDLHRPSADGR